MKTRHLLLLGLLCAGCVPSWNPFYTDKDLVFDPTLVAAWKPTEGPAESPETWAFTRASDRSYQLLHTDEEKRQATFDVRLFRLNNQRFIDLYLTRIEGDGLKVNAWAGVSLVPAHILLKVEQIEPTLKLAAMNPDWLKKHLQQRPDAIAHRVMADGSLVLAATTADLQKFILAHLADDEFFGGPMELKRR